MTNAAIGRMDVLATAIMPGETRDKIMFITENTSNGLEYVAHTTAEAGVAYLLDSLGSDYENDFWTTDGKTIALNGALFGKTIARNGAFLDFDVCVHNSPGDAVESLVSYDPDALPTALRLLADAIEAGLKAGLE